MEMCVFCSQLRTGTARDPWNEPVLETANFVVLPSLGALVDGWSLLVPKQHYLSMGALPTDMRSEADELQKTVEGRLMSRFGNPITRFEHGPSAAKHGTGCGVDHAHLHILPGHFDLCKLSQIFVPADTQWMGGGWNERSAAFEAGLDYLFLQEGEQQATFATARDFGSQVFRKAIASRIGIPREYNWREYPRHERAINTGMFLRRRGPTEEREYVA